MKWPQVFFAFGIPGDSSVRGYCCKGRSLKFEAGFESPQGFRGRRNDVSAVMMSWGTSEGESHRLTTVLFGFQWGICLFCSLNCLGVGNSGPKGIFSLGHLMRFDRANSYLIDTGYLQ